MAWPETIVWVRHAQSEGNLKTVDERAAWNVASPDYKLTSLGRKQARITGEFLRKKFGKFDVYYVSYYDRSRETMKIMYPDARVYEDPRLAEAQRGIWNSLTKQQIDELFPKESERKQREGLYHHRPLGGENWPDIELRIHSFLGTLSRDCGGQKVLIVAHGHWLLLYQRLIHHFSIEETVKRYENGIFKNASVTIYKGKTIGGKSRLVLAGENIVPWEGKI